MRLLTVHPDRARGTAPCTTEVDVDPGTTVAALRPHLARLTGWAGWASTAVRLAVDDAVLDETHPAGHHPLVAGALLRAGPGRPPVERAAVQARRHVAVVAGPDSGAVVAVPVGGVVPLSDVGADDVALGAVTVRGRGRRVQVRVARAASGGATRPDAPAGGGVRSVQRDRRSGTAAAARRVGRDRSSGTAATVLRVGRDRSSGTAPTFRRVGRDRSTETAAGARWVRLDRSGAPARDAPEVAGRSGPHARGERVGHGRDPDGRAWRPRGRAHRLRAGRWVRWHERDVLVVGRSTLALRPAPTASVEHRASTEADRADERGGAEQAVTWLAPLAGSVALAVVLRQPALLLVGLVVPLVGLAVHVARRRRRRPAATADPEAPVAERPPHDPADLVAATVAALLGWGGRVRGGAPWSADGCLAVVGEPAQAAGTARAVVLAELGSHAAVGLAVLARRPVDWTWTTPVEPRATLPAPDDPRHVVVCDDPAAIGGLAAWRSSAPARHRLLLVLDRRADVPAWCRTVLEVRPGGAVLHVAGATQQSVPWHSVTTGRARAQLVRARTVRDLTRDGTPTLEPPGAVALGDLPDVPAAQPAAVARVWSEARPGLVAPLGRGPGSREVRVDLVADGPHALVAGTTGAGKSELLSTLVLALALAQPPDRLAVLLVDFKGGTGLGGVAGLPHVLDHVTDLDAARTTRVLAGLRAETRRRERVLAVHGAHDLADLDPDDDATPPRLLVVVDELRALADDVPDAVPALARLAAQGRALGIHLVLATQRPAGVVTADLRANVELRIALRVADDADSRDVVDDAHAARLDARTPGRAVLRRGARPVELVQVARPRLGTGAPPARLAVVGLPGAAAGWVPAPHPVGRGPEEHAGDGGAAPWVRAAQDAARGRRVQRVPWVPALPDHVSPDDVPPGPGLAVALADLPDEQRRAPVRWDPTGGHLLVLGGPGSGRTTTLTGLGEQALAAGVPVHAVGLPDAAVARLRRADTHGRLGTTVGVHEVRRLARLLELLPASPVPSLLLVDGLTTALDHLATLARGAGADRLTACWRGDARVAVAAAADVTSAALHHAAAFRDRLVLPVTDASLDSLAGVPAPLTGPRGPAGRAVHLRDGGAVLCQIAEPPRTDADPPRPGGDRSEPRPLDPAVVRVAALPSTVVLPAAQVTNRAGVQRVTGTDGTLGPDVQRVTGVHGTLSPDVQRVTGVRGTLSPDVQRVTGVRGTLCPEVTGAGGAVGPDVAAGRGGAIGPDVAVGRGGDDAGEVVVDTSRSLLVAGPPGSGRSTVLAVLAAGLRDRGTPVVRLATAAGTPDPRLADLPAVAPDDVPDDAVLLVDDLDELERASPAAADAVERLVQASAGRRGGRVVASTTAQAAGAFRGPHAALVRGRQVLVLDAHDPAGAELVGPAAPWLVDPRERPPGRAVLVVDRRAVPVQVYDVRAGASSPGR
ncbi:FtsK/SpoIIIE domain-containing protein [Cellulomonas fimi]|uniref:FtsK/SpoIIIE domain-containing protein n=1 Tax=Cellulomonas fimi TaxID=1708 RepID=UPI00235864D4|nr:FtsK/SpoIIIE domain-containing protein [Cellulomonas fimi]